MQANTPNTASATSNSGSAAQTGRPVRRNFYNTVVIKNNGATVPEADWKAIATGTTPREVRKQLKQAGMQAVRVFNTEGYNTARSDYKNGMKNDAKSARESVITEAFEAAGVPVHPRLSSSLRTLLPMFKGAPANKTIAAFKNIIKTVAGAGDMSVRQAKADDQAAAASTVH